VNLGNPEEITITRLAETIRDAAGSSSIIVNVPRPVDDPENRRPDLTVARRLLGWAPAVSLQDGLRFTIDWARATWT
jgi:nucleoside-diphosphate-sugar epimerase